MTDPVRIHPNVSEIYRQKVESLREALNREDARAEATAVLRELIAGIRLAPIDGKL